MLKREHNSEYTAKLLKEHAMELLQAPPYMPPGRNKPLQRWKRGKKAEWRHLVRSVKDIKWEDQIWDSVIIRSKKQSFSPLKWVFSKEVKKKSYYPINQGHIREKEKLLKTTHLFMVLPEDLYWK